MNYFLEETARHILSGHSGPLSELCLVFPNRRAGRFFQRYLAGMLKQPVWSPAIMSISDLMQDLSGLQKADHLSLIFDLHQVFRKEKKSSESFDEFYHWGEMLLRDFDDIDKYLADPRDVFRNLARLKSIDEQFSYLTEEQIKAIRQFWDAFDIQSLSGEQDDFIRIWEILHKVYQSFNRRLDQKGRAYEGKIYRRVVERIRSETLNFRYDQYVFAGFNALTPAEKKLFRELRRNGKADFYWDYDEYYLRDHEAGRFIRSNLLEFPGHDLDIYQDFSRDKHIRFINTPYDIAQAKILPDLLADLAGNKDAKPDRTAIVLPDEQLLLPVLNSLPEELPSVNVTMGYPVYATPAYSFLLSLIQLQQNARKQEQRAAFYYQDVLSILNHQYLGIIRDRKIEELNRSIHQHNKIYVAQPELQVDDLLGSIFKIPEDYNTLSDYLLENYERFYRLLKDRSREQEDSLKMELESIYHVYLSVKRLKEIFSAQQAEVGTATYLRILERVIMSQSIPFRGEPLSGLQVMGILETRTLDFENLIILSMNEGIFPAAEASPSFIPFSLRKGFGLPTHEYHDAIYAYYFYRLIQRARNITLVYNSGTDGLKTGEMSRFMHQLRLESGHSISEETVVSGLDIPGEKTISVAKTAEIMDILEQYDHLKGGRRTLSPSALNTYLVCPLKFYFRYIAGLEEPQEITEDVDLRLFGNLLHKALHLIYKPYVGDGEDITRDDLKRLEKNEAAIEHRILEAFREEYFSDLPTAQPLNLSGKNLLVKDIIQHYIRQLLRTDQQFVPFRPVSLERKYYGAVHFTMNGEDKQVMMKGSIDRVDQQAGAIRIIDYKTGRPGGNIRDIASLFESKGNHAALQALLYCRLYDQNRDHEKPLIPGLYYFRQIYQQHFDYRLSINKKPVIYDEVAGEVEEELQNVMKQLFDPGIPFDQTDDRNACRQCPYAEICRRKQV